MKRYYETNSDRLLEELDIQEAEIMARKIKKLKGGKNSRDSDNRVKHKFR